MKKNIIKNLFVVSLFVFLAGFGLLVDLKDQDRNAIESYESAQNYIQDRLSENNAMQKNMFMVAKPKHESIRLIVTDGDTIGQLLHKLDINGALVHKSLAELDKHFKLKNVKPGHEMIVHFDIQQSENLLKKEFVGFEFTPKKLETYIVSRVDEDTFNAKVLKTEIYKQLAHQEVIVESNIFQSGSKYHVPKSVLNSLLDTYKFEVDFQKEIRSGDKFRVVYEEYRTDEGDLYKTGDLLFASLTMKGETKALYRYKKSNGQVDYFDYQGQARQQGLLKQPVKGAKLSSKFGMRMHPVLNKRRMHKGIDWAAPSGTPIYVAGDGVITYKGHKGGLGNYMEVSHSNRLSTGYAHMRAFANGLTNGSRVKQGQLIGYIGCTGRATGAHLHYEVKKDGVQVNPLKFTLPPSEVLKNQEYDRFMDHIGVLHAQYAEIKADIFADALTIPAKRPQYLLSEN